MTTRPSTYRQFRVLHREFLFRVVDRELLSRHGTGDASQLLVQVAALLIFLSVIILRLALNFTSDVVSQGRLLLSWTMEHFLIATTMLVVGLFAVLSWDNMYPDRRDVFVLAPLPVRVRTVLLAKVAATATALTLTVLAFHAAGGLVWPLVFNAATPAVAIPAWTSDRASPPVGAADLSSVLAQDFAQVLKRGPLAPGAGGGVAIGVYTRGVRRVFAFGAATTDSLFEIGSSTKTFTGLALAHMAEEGKVRLDQPVRELLPRVEIPAPREAEITLLDLATHRSGLPGLPDNFQPGDKKVEATTKALAASDAAKLHAFLSRRGVGKLADGAFKYSNLGFGLLGHALATRAGTDYPTLIRETITGPLGMADTEIVLSPSQQRRFLQGFSADRQPVPTYDLDALAGMGGLRSTAPDMLAWLEAHLHPERLPSGTLRAAVSSSHQVRPTTWGGPRIALAWFAPSDTGLYTHGGTTAGYTADMFFSPREDTAAVVLSNTGPMSVVSADVLGEHVRARLAGTPAVSIEETMIPAGGGMAGLLRLYLAYWLTMFAAAVFIFGMVMSVQGMAALCLSRSYFLRVSSFLQLGAFVLIVSVYCLQSLGIASESLTAAQRGGLLASSPSYWFLGLFQTLNGSPALAPLARRAWAAVGLAIVGAAAGYALSYVRVLRKIAEEPDIESGLSGLRWLPPFGSQFQTAIVQFSIRTLLRSTQHRVIMAFYLGIGFAAAIFLVKLPRFQASTPSAGEGWLEGSVPMIASSLLMLGFAALGGRIAFSLPRDLLGNWIFRITPLHGGLRLLMARRRALFALSVAPVWAVWAVLLFWSWPWRPAVGHLVVLVLLAALLVELSVQGIQKVPFTCAYLPGRSVIHLTFWVAMLLVVPLAFRAAREERQALQDPVRYAAIVAGLALAWAGARWGIGWLRNAAAATPPEFEEERPGEMTHLNLWDSRPHTVDAPAVEPMRLPPAVL